MGGSFQESPKNYHIRDSIKSSEVPLAYRNSAGTELVVLSKIPRQKVQRLEPLLIDDIWDRPISVMQFTHPVHEYWYARPLCILLW